MSQLYRTTNWRRVLALVLVFVMMLSTMGTSGYSVFAENIADGYEAAADEPDEETDVIPDEETPLAPYEEDTEIDDE